MAEEAKSADLKVGDSEISPGLRFPAISRSMYSQSWTNDMLQDPSLHALSTDGAQQKKKTKKKTQTEGCFPFSPPFCMSFTAFILSSWCKRRRFFIFFNETFIKLLH